MDKRAGLRQFYTDQEQKALASKQFADRTAQLNDFEDTVLRAFKTLIQFMDGKTTKTEVVNQLKSISTPDVDKVVQAVSKLDRDILANKLDLKPITDALNGLKREVTLLPAKMPKAEAQRDSVKVENLNEITFDTTSLEAAIKALKLDPTIDVKAPIVNVDAPDLSPIKTVMLDVLKAIKDQKYPEVPATDLKTLEAESKKTNKQLEDANKKLQKLVEKPVGGGGGGGGNGTPYQNEAGNASYVTLENGAVPYIKQPQAKKITVAAPYTYIAVAAPGTLQASALWQVQRIDESVAGTTVITWADGNSDFDNVATNLTTLSYS